MWIVLQQMTTKVYQTSTFSPSKDLFGVPSYSMIMVNIFMSDSKNPHPLLCSYIGRVFPLVSCTIKSLEQDFIL